MEEFLYTKNWFFAAMDNPAYEGVHYGNRICQSVYINRIDWRISPLEMRINEELSYQKKMLGYFEEGMTLFDEARG